jgi:hypothetical protein
MVVARRYGLPDYGSIRPAHAISPAGAATTANTIVRPLISLIVSHETAIWPQFVMRPA